ncbi:conserved protein of unknown function [Streptococcus thermophilus]|uniref:CopG family transcriptional regulator n=1 Tax=Streptococcus thermophilus TaxID=1308 RepID=A0A8D6U802_STRTR|nr:hypothetical protein [Streptococcus thermophilus]CAD0145802.1 conserved protein of unknown function [Streptococcus thermophilus]CAD0152852.1 conserved protein of unknown function [Streptococcus thermophilus]
MAFESKKEKISKVLQEEIKDPKPQKKRERKAGRPSGKTKFPYQFTLKPQNREKLDRIAEASGYSGASTFLDEWIEQYQE